MVRARRTGTGGSSSVCCRIDRPQLSPSRARNLWRGSAACALVIDNADRRGNERVWVSIADTIRATASNKRGAHNGWATTTTTDVNDPSGFVARHGGQPGTSWDLYNVKASESLTSSAGSIGNRLAFRDPSNSADQRQGRTPGTLLPDMLRAYYKIIVFMSGDPNHGVLGPYVNRSQDDGRHPSRLAAVGEPDRAQPDRGLWAIGDGFVESNYGEGFGSSQDNFDTNFPGVDLRNPSYVRETGNLSSCRTFFPLACRRRRAIFGVRSRCLWTNECARPFARPCRRDLLISPRTIQPSFPLPTLTVERVQATQPEPALGIAGRRVRHREPHPRVSTRTPWAAFATPLAC